MTEKGLSARESFVTAFEAVRQKLNGKEVILPKTPEAEIANDSDYHRTKVGYSAYKKVALVTVDGKEWVVALGFACGDYPADRYNCDIAAIPVSSTGKPNEQLAEEIHDILEGNYYFKNSIVIAMADGRIALNSRGPFREIMLKTLGTGMPTEFTAQQLEHQEGVLHADCRPVVKYGKRYTKEFPIYLSDRICETLAACA